MEFDIIPDKEALGQCACCRNPIDDHMELFGFGARLKSGIDLSGYESHCIQIRLLSGDKDVFTMVTIEGSEARNDGNDCMFLVCSEKCENELKAALEKEISSGNMFASIQDGDD